MFCIIGLSFIPIVQFFWFNFKPQLQSSNISQQIPFCFICFIRRVKKNVYLWIFGFCVQYVLMTVTAEICSNTFFKRYYLYFFDLGIEEKNFFLYYLFDNWYMEGKLHVKKKSCLKAKSLFTWYKTNNFLLLVTEKKQRIGVLFYKNKISYISSHYFLMFWNFLSNFWYTFCNISIRLLLIFSFCNTAFIKHFCRTNLFPPNCSTSG